jgi:hypothetical protein
MASADSSSSVVEELAVATSSSTDLEEASSPYLELLVEMVEGLDIPSSAEAS